jgi:hypothetical protein
MATVMAMRWEGVTQEQYDAVMDGLGLDDELPDGGIFHIAGFENGAMRVIDVWDSQGAFEQFMGQRLQPVIQEVGLAGEPEVVYYELYNVWAPRGQELVEQGATAKAAA